LQPEKSINYELGMQLFSKNKQSNIRFAGFKRDIKDLIIFYTNPITYDSKYINRDTQHDYGVELESTVAIGKKTSWVNNITYVDGEGETNAVKVKNLYRRPNVTWSSILNLQPTKSLTLMPSFRYVGTRVKGTYDAGPEKMPAYYTLDFYVGYAASKKAKLFIDLKNITNQEYFEIVGYNSKRFNMMVGCNWTL
jgi:vitamin B12 transporter